MEQNPLQWVECPRDAMQGFAHHIPTQTKIDYLNRLLDCGFHTLDFGSFVSPKAIPQLADTKEVLAQIHWQNSKTSLLAIVANLRGAEEASKLEGIRYLGFPFSLSETFQQRNTNAGQQQAFETVKALQALCVKHQKELVIYFSMGFGNPYGDPWHPDMIGEWLEKMSTLQIPIVSLADTVGVAEPEDIYNAFTTLIPKYTHMTLGAHLHTRYDDWRPKINAAWDGGCRRFDTAMKGFGGCPMAGDELTGNFPSEHFLTWLEEVGNPNPVNKIAFEEAMRYANHVFVSH